MAPCLSVLLFGDRRVSLLRFGGDGRRSLLLGGERRTTLRGGDDRLLGLLECDRYRLEALRSYEGE